MAVSVPIVDGAGARGDPRRTATVHDRRVVEPTQSGAVTRRDRDDTDRRRPIATSPVGSASTPSQYRQRGTPLHGGAS